MKKILFILLIALLPLQGFSQSPGIFSIVISRDSICLGDSCVNYIYPDTLPNTQWVRDFVENFEIDFDSLDVVYINVGNINVEDTLQSPLVITDEIRNESYLYTSVGSTDQELYGNGLFSLFLYDDASPLADGNLSVSKTQLYYDNSLSGSDKSAIFRVGQNTNPAALIETNTGTVQHTMSFDGRITSPKQLFEIETYGSSGTTEYFSLDTTEFRIGFDKQPLSPDPQYSFKKDSFKTTVPITGAHGHEETKQNTITVAKSGGDYTTIKEAVNSITNSCDTNRFIVDVYSGIYSEDNPINLPSYVALRANGDVGTSVIVPLNVGAVINGAGNTTVSGFSIFSGSTGPATNTGVRMDSLGFMRIDDMVFNSIDTGMYISNPLSATFSENVFIVSDSARVDVGIFVDGGNVTTNNLRVPGIDSISTLVLVKGGNSSAIINGMISGSYNLDTAVYATDTALVIINTSTLSNCHNGLMSFNEADLKFNGNTHTNFTGAFTTEGNGGKLRGYANNNDNDEALIIEGQELHVGDAAQGYEVCIGEGDSYSDDLLAYMYDGSTYWSTGDSLKDADGIYVEYPNLLVNTALYVASDVGDSIIHHGIKLSMVDSMTVGAGEVLTEYWNGSTWTEFNCMVTDGSEPYAPRSKAYFEQTQGTHIRYNIAMTNDDWIANDPVSHGSVKKWVRYRIATAITQTPQIDQIKLHPSRWEANADGFNELFGNARNSQLLPLNIGAGEPFEGNMQSQTIYVDENIGVGFQNNRFTATGDKLGYAINFPDNIDTGSPINIVWSGRYVTGGTAQWTIRYKIVSPGDNLYTSEPAATGTSGTVIVDATVTASINEIFSASIDVSEALPTREGGFGDQLWFSFQPTTLPGNFDITNIGAAYITWAEGGHY